MKIEVNGTEYEVEIIGEKVRVNNKELRVNLNEDKITIEGRIFHSDFVQDGEPSLMIINSMIYLVSKRSLIHASLKEIKAPISGEITNVLVNVGSRVKEGQTLVLIEAMKMEIQIKSPVSGMIIKEIKVSKGHSVKTGDPLLLFE
ncbi:MAG: biotin/lipoyl-containing protein [Nitrososphaeraceae archaeon]